VCQEDKAVIVTDHAEERKEFAHQEFLMQNIVWIILHIHLNYYKNRGKIRALTVQKCGNTTGKPAVSSARLW